MAFFVDIDSVIGSVKETYGSYAEEHDRYLYEWAYRCVTEIGIAYLSVQEETIKIDGNEFPRPMGYVAPQNIILINEAGRCVQPYFNHPDRFIQSCCKNPVKSCCGSSCGSCKNKVFVEEHYDVFRLSSNAEGVYKKARLRYYGIPVQDGNLMVPYYCMEAIEAYLEFRLEKIKKRKQQALKRSNLLNDVRDARQVYNMELQKAKNRTKKNPASIKEAGLQNLGLNSPMAMLGCGAYKRMF